MADSLSFVIEKQCAFNILSQPMTICYAHDNLILCSLGFPVMTKMVLYGQPNESIGRLIIAFNLIYFLNTNYNYKGQKKWSRQDCL